MMRNKHGGSTGLIISIIIILILVTITAILIMNTTFFRNLMFDLRGETVSCSNAPTYKNCVCGEEFDKTLVDEEYICLPQSPETSLDCAWCNNECVEWRKLPEPGLGGCDRTPLIGKVCIVDTIAGHKLCAAKTPVPQGDLITFCTKEEFINTIDFFEGDFAALNTYLGEHCDGLVFPLDNCETSYSGSIGSVNVCPSGEECTTFEVLNTECRSICRDENGTMIGGHIPWRGIFDISTGEPLDFPVEVVSVIPYPTDACQRE